MNYPTVTDILAEQKKPVIAIDNHGLITFINEAFRRQYGWTSDELVGQVVTRIMPPHMRDAHNSGFSRFLLSEEPRILNKHLYLPVYCKDGTVIDAEHYITGEKHGNDWRFAATISPKGKAS